MKAPAVNRINFFTDKNNALALKWEKDIKSWLKRKYPEIKTSDKNFQIIVALGGDGTIMKAAKICAQADAILMGLNLGKFGFLASVRKSRDFFKALEKILRQDYYISNRIMVDYSVIRDKKAVFKANALNEVIVINPLGMVEIDVFVEDHHLQKIKGTGALVSTPTGSTAFNLSAHGPVVMPDIEGLILMELFDHNIPTPAIILSKNKNVRFKIVSFRKRNLLSQKGTKKTVDLMLVADGDTIFTLERDDEIRIKKSPQTVRIAEIEDNHFLKSLGDKFDFK